MKKIVAISGSLRRESYNTSLLKMISKMLPEDIEYEILDISQIPLFNEDQEAKEIPKSVIELKHKIKDSYLVIIATPEYNHSTSGVLKNALDWFSRGDLLPFQNKDVIIISASLSRFGGARAQMHLREILFRLKAHVLNSPEICIGNASEINAEKISKYLEPLIEFILTN